MARYCATIDVETSPAEVFAYLRDPLHRAEWDPSVRRVSAAGDETYDVTVGFYGKAIEATYRLDEVVEPTRIVFTVDGKVTGRDVIDIAAREGGATVRLDLEVKMKGAARLLDRGLQLAFAGIGDNIVAELERRF